MQERIQKILAQAGIASRRKCEQLIAQGKVLVNGKVAVLGDKAEAGKDKIVVSGKPVVLEKKIYVLLNKPKGYVTTVSEQHDMRTIMHLVKVPERVFPVGRLDKDTEGLILLTNDGDLANKLTHPRYEVEKEYVVFLDKPLSDEAMEKLQHGVTIDDRKVKIRGLDVWEREVVLRIHEGRKHIVRRLFEKLGFAVTRLIRTRVASLKLEKLQSGKWRELTEVELKSLKR